ncbi:MAG: glycosyltransferase, partial [Clostridia bacterium]|nr:glycosyltransferase [Clostridia bacterium]
FSLTGTVLLSDMMTAFTLSGILAILDIALLLALTRAVKRRHTLSPMHSHHLRLTKQSVFRAVWVILSGTFLPLLTLFTTLSSASLSGEEGISLNGYASRLVLLSAALLISVTHATYYATMARSREKAKTLRHIFLRLLIVSATVTFLIILFARPMMRLLYRNSALTDTEIDRLASLLTAYAPSVIALTLSSLLSDFAYLRNQTPHITIGNFLAIAAVGSLYAIFGISSLTAVPFYFTLAAFLRLIFAITTVASKPIRDKARILLVLSDCNIGGAGRWLLTYLRYANRNAFDICIALPKGAMLKKPVTDLGYPVYEMGTERSFSLANTLAACRLMLKLRPDLINTSASLSARIAAFVLRVPVRLYTRHCVYPPSTLFFSPTVRLINRVTNRILTPSAVAVAIEAQKNLVEMGIARKTVTVIENGVTPITYVPDSRKTVRERFGIGNITTVAICARLEKDKSINTLIEAIAIIKARNIPFHALIVGTGSEEAALKRLSDILGVSDLVHFCGFVSDVAPYLNAADLYANCSVGSEATSLAIAEAMSLSLPIVASDYGGNPHMVIDGYNGILVRQRDPLELADALMILTDRVLRKHFGSSSFEHYVSYYRAEDMAKKYETLYHTLLHRKGYPLL